VYGRAVAGYNAAVGAGQPTTAANLASQITALGAFAQLNNTGLSPGIPSVNFSGAPFGPSGFTNLAIALGGPSFIGSTLNGAHLDDAYRQTSKNFALFTHDIISVTDQLKVTLALVGLTKENAERRPYRQQQPVHRLLGRLAPAAPCVIPSARRSLQHRGLAQRIESLGYRSH
jgi:hypothetical protein